ncbi:hypothetical protein MSG28_013954 [Choristoneura fumiferana]|uniref:Uncharacterized protein n=1 Tax=Choristoneura fumiferana TaxID=7141 RepID=A0ACC0K9K4_CHOFU|nr:hypothetical protein MSG28_013954 [Choristoneura fumiferana]
MPKAMREILQNGNSYDETDRMPDNITITHFDIIMYVVAIVGHFVDLGLDINVAVRYAQDKQQVSITNEVTKRHWLRIFILVLQMAPILRFTDALM